ncbi:hypothetical protein E2C01_068558 [Portunus trituberculatus]|uniref:Uncharacterized protein n=1 Tax=Portunus trituberculatus TaxID=210409 RepID=A0A5B7HWT6_PORTR|nr:hypothetical protein [Portunus trituberculatus]
MSCGLCHVGGKAEQRGRCCRQCIVKLRVLMDSAAEKKKMSFVTCIDLSQTRERIKRQQLVSHATLTPGHRQGEAVLVDGLVVERCNTRYPLLTTHCSLLTATLTQSLFAADGPAEFVGLSDSR